MPSAMAAISSSAIISLLSPTILYRYAIVPLLVVGCWLIVGYFPSIRASETLSKNPSLLQSTATLPSLPSTPSFALLQPCYIVMPSFHDCVFIHCWLFAFNWGKQDIIQKSIIAEIHCVIIALLL